MQLRDLQLDDVGCVVFLQSCPIINKLTGQLEVTNSSDIACDYFAQLAKLAHLNLMIIYIYIYVHITYHIYIYYISRISSP